MKKRTKIIVLAIALVVVAILGICLFLKYNTYHYMEITESYDNSNKDNANYISCMNGILRYSRDGVVLLTKEGEERWNQPSQMSNPIVEMCGNSVAVADKEGTSILVFSEKGLRGEIKTTRPIEKVSVSSQGVVSAILKDEETPLVMCYDAKGNILVEHKVSLKNMGYPIDIALSEDGKTLIVSYLNTTSSQMISLVSYYYFGNAEVDNKDHLVYQKEFEDTIVPITTFLDGENSLLVADNALIFYKGLKKPKEAGRVDIKGEIQSVAYSDNMVAVLVKKEGDAAYKLQLYNKRGKELVSVDVDKEFSQIKVVEDQVILYDGQMCSIFMKDGIHKYDGKTEENILEIFPLHGINRYMVINASGFHEVRLAK